MDVTYRLQFAHNLQITIGLDPQVRDSLSQWGEANESDTECEV